MSTVIEVEVEAEVKVVDNSIAQTTTIGVCGMQLFSCAHGTTYICT